MHCSAPCSQNVTLSGNDWYFCRTYASTGLCKASLCGRCKNYLDVHKEHFDEHANSKPMADARKRAGNVSNEGKARARRATRSTAGMCKKVKNTHTRDDSECDHGNPNFWHLASKAYSSRSWRKKNTCRPSLKCSNCKETV